MLLKWPAGKRFAVAVTFDVDGDEVWRAEGRDLPVPISQGTYGMKVGVPAVLDLLERLHVPATFFVTGRVAERDPRMVRDPLAAGHEVAAHGFSHRPPCDLDPAAEEQELERARSVLESLGARVRGYRAPAWGMSVSTVSLLASHGFRYSSNFMDDVMPYLHEGTSLVELPVHWVLDDAPHFWFDAQDWTKKISDPEEVRSVWEEEILGIADLGGVAVLTLHPQIIGRPGRLRMLEGFLRFLASLPHAWTARCEEIAALAFDQLAGGEAP